MTLTLPATALLLLSIAGSPQPIAEPMAGCAAPVAAHVCAIDDPDPADCPFCGGNPAVHVRSIFALERTTLLVHATMLH